MTFLKAIHHESDRTYNFAHFYYYIDCQDKGHGNNL